MAMVLRPMNLGEIFDRSFEIYRKNLLLFIGIAAIPELAILGLHLADDLWLHLRTLVHTSRQERRVLWEFVLGIGYFHVGSFLGLLLLPAYLQASSNAIFDRPNSIVDALRFAAARWRSYLWIAILKHLSQLVVPQILAIVLMFVFGFIAYALGILKGPPVILATFVIFLPIFLYGLFTLWLGARLAFWIPVAVFEERTGLKALRHSWALSIGGRWRIAFTWASVDAIAWTAMLTLLYLARTLTNFLYSAHRLHEFNQDIYYGMLHLMYAPAVILLGPVYPIALTLLYYDQRMRREGFDIEKMMESAGLMEASATGEDEVNGSVSAETADESV